MATNQPEIPTMAKSPASSSPPSSQETPKAPALDAAKTKQLQKDLNALGTKPALVVDGILGYATRTALLSFQGAAGLVPDGIAGPKTQAALAKALEDKAAEARPAAGRMRIILVRGKLGEIYSRGMDTLADELNKLPGVVATVENYGMFYTNADDHAAALEGALKGGFDFIGIAGHSMGGDSAAKTAWLLNGRGIPLHLLGAIDPTPFGCPTIAPNVVNCLSYANTGYAMQLGGHQIQPGAGFSGRYRHKDLPLRHIEIDDDHGTVHSEFISTVKRIMVPR
jgi:hypothetical protein